MVCTTSGVGLYECLYGFDDIKKRYFRNHRGHRWGVLLGLECTEASPCCAIATMKNPGDCRGRVSQKTECPKSGNADQPVARDARFNHGSVVGTIRIEIVPFAIPEVDPPGIIAFLARLNGCLCLFVFLRLLKLR
jgi:hypothetical protein